MGGIAAASGEWIFLCDGDGQFCLDEFREFVPELREYTAVLGFRKKRRDPWFRKLNSFIYNAAARVLLGVRVRDNGRGRPFQGNWRKPSPPSYGNAQRGAAGRGS